MITKPHDLLGKTLMGGLLELQGETRIEVEVPPVDAKRFDVWFIPDEVKQRGAPRFCGVLAQIARACAVIEIWSGRIGEREFLDSYEKCHAWWRVLERRAKAACPRPRLWHLAAGRPKLVLKRFGFQPIRGSPGHYRTEHPGWQVDLVVIPELPKTRDILLLRLLGDEQVGEEALRDLKALPDDAWEKELAVSWIERLQLHVPSSALSSDETTGNFLMTMLEWYREKKKQEDAALTQKVAQKVTREVTREVTRQFEQQLMHERIHVFERRLDRALTAAERRTVVKQIRELGPERVLDVALSLSPKELAVWLKG